MRYSGQCHCGAVKFEFEGQPIEKGLRCNCSYCVKRGILATGEVIPPEKFRFEAEPGQLSLYQFSAKTAKHYFCMTCGVHPFYVTVRKKGHFRANIACINEVDEPLELDYDVFDGKHLL